MKQNYLVRLQIHWVLPARCPEARGSKILHQKDISASRYRSTITQVPPKYSALKVNGRFTTNISREDEEEIDIEAKSVRQR